MLENDVNKRIALTKDVYKRQLLIVQSIDNAVRIEDILAIDTEVVAIIMLLELQQGLLISCLLYTSRCV